MLSVHYCNLNTQIYRVHFEGRQKKKKPKHVKWDQMHCDLPEVEYSRLCTCP